MSVLALLPPPPAAAATGRSFHWNFISTKKIKLVGQRKLYKLLKISNKPMSKRIDWPNINRVIVMFTSFYCVAFTAKKPNVNINYYSVNFGIESEVYATLLGTCCLSMGLDGVTRKCNGCFKVPKCF